MWYAHSLPDQPKSDWQLLKTHLQDVGALAGRFAAVFDAQSWGQICGMLHDAGKYTCAFQRRLEGDPKRVDHSSEGGRIALDRYGKGLGRLLAYAVLGHHGHLPNAGSTQQSSSLEQRLHAYPVSKSSFFEECALPDLAALPQHMVPRTGFERAFFVRMLFSCLVDADCLDTERFMDPDKAALRAFPDVDTERQALRRCKTALDAHLTQIAKRAEDTNVNRQRAGVLAACRAAASHAPGLFALTVPTGGGKTLSSMAFALGHALTHGQRRILYISPFTSITEQTAGVYRSIFGPNAILEHHSAVDTAYKNEDDEYDDRLRRQLQLATENWASPIVVTTAVQFFESLFASRKWRCRKLHNIAGSVIVLDEAQTLPDALLLPTLAALDTLCAQYGCTVVLCTATQPALDGWWPGKVIPREIIPDSGALYRALRRTQVFQLGILDLEQVAQQLCAHPQALCIVSTRARARMLYGLLQDQPNVYHLSARMCAEHRHQVLEKIRAHLKSEEPCLVVSTQLIEAGVDVDFAAVYREIGGIDAIAQAAGRCNREGRRAEGPVYVYRPAEGLPKGWVSQCAAVTDTVLSQYKDPLSLEAVRAYSQKRYALHGKEALDEHNILSDLNGREVARQLRFEFRDIAGKYKLIEDTGGNVYIPYGKEGKRLVNELYDTEPENRGLLARALQRYSVGLYPQEYQKMLAAGWIDVVDDLYPILIPALAEKGGYYCEKIGLKPLDTQMETAQLTY
ncbi:MAG: CRISPR-associated helicase Cas3' [Clostridiales bacterium]|nr:CRISPR-associated helicase Cas3' [Clostridiales bacterium]